MRFLLPAFTVILCACACGAGEEPAAPPSVQVPKLAEGPEFKADLGGPFWEKAARLGAFRKLDGAAGEPAQQTEVRVATTAEALWIGVRCLECDLGGLKAQQDVRDTAIWMDDGIELFLKTGPEGAEPYYQIGFNAAGTIFDAHRKLEMWDGAGIRATTGRSKDAWLAVIEIPLKTLTSETPAKKGEAWRLNVIRVRPKHEGNKGQDEETAWAPTGQSTSHVPERFGFAYLEAFEAKMPGSQEGAKEERK
ncbi:MAG: carbohydrate-binding family 9-like protein [Planctomycetes bacterium]|nr:carbohydrate-binding family 9-like protein [Planctomycetota bacterium]